METYYSEEFLNSLDTLEVEGADKVPDYVILTYAICGGSPQSCGWTGWLLEAAFRVTGDAHQTATGDQIANAITNQVCPSCEQTVFRTGLSRRFVERPTGS